MLGQNYFTRKTIGWGTMALFHCHDVKEQPASAVILAMGFPRRVRTLQVMVPSTLPSMEMSPVLTKSPVTSVSALIRVC